MVPSWTETLIACDVQVLGRTRFCIEPVDRVKTIPTVGGTKDINWDKVVTLAPDLVLLDQEENPKWMSEGPVPAFSTHVTKISDVSRELERLGTHLNNSKLLALSARWKKVEQAERRGLSSWQELPGTLKWLRLPQKEITKVLYVIWRDPWMGVSQETFIGSVLDHVGIGSLLPTSIQKYPILDLDQYEPQKTLLLFASEPYPFHKKTAEVTGLPNPMALVDGQSYSWFGIRTLQFLENLK